MKARSVYVNVLLSCITVFVAVPNMAQAVVLVEELFYYPEGSSVYGQSGGTGLSGTWSSSGSGTLNMEDFGGTVRPHMVPVSGSTYSVRSLTTPLAEVGDYRIGVTMDIDDQIATRFFVLLLGGNPGPVRLVVNLNMQAGADTFSMWVVNYGNDVDNWKAATSSPGVANP